ncbi:MAG: hypothetical protein J1F35_07045 [Erysipelotrichales bacterium]|nr:hypothetical protein [Erysipelotrichales bacterium]
MENIKKEFEKVVKKIYVRFGFSEEQTESIFSNYEYSFKNISEVESTLKNYFTSMKELGYNKQEACLLVTEYPNAIFYNFQLKGMSDKYKKCLESSKEEESFNFECSSIREILENLEVEQEIMDMAFNDNHKIISMNPKTVSDNIRFYLNCGMTLRELKFCVNNTLQVLEVGEEYYAELLKEIEFFGLNQSGLVKLITKSAHNNKIINTTDFIAMLQVAKTKKLDYKRFGQSILKSIKTENCTKKRFINGYNNLMSLNFSEEQTCNIISDYAYVITMNKNTLEYKKSILENYTHDENTALEVISDFPYYLALSPKKIIDRLDAAFRFGILWFIIKHPKNLIQSGRVTEDRALYLRLHHSYLDEIELAKDVYESEKNFAQKYNKTNEQLKKLMY